MELRPLGKKADLSLSINAIVILILAITMLGLGLGFLRNTFSKTTAQFSEVADDVKSQVVAKIQASNEKLAFDKLEIELKRGETKDLFYGIKNVLEVELETFTITSGCDKALKETTPVGAESGVTFGTFPTWDVKQGEVEVLKLTATAKPDAALDTYSCFLKLDGASAPGYATKKFFVVVK
ncbi:MAG TPA: hypothetical protein VKE88_04030 [Candidatus Nanoarchaeia archaeon]|nr:hypothetical protein [Candidatus Nanoarchaeia archaeon]